MCEGLRGDKKGACSLQRNERRPCGGQSLIDLGGNC